MRRRRKRNPCPVGRTPLERHEGIARWPEPRQSRLYAVASEQRHTSERSLSMVKRSHRPTLCLTIALNLWVVAWCSAQPPQKIPGVGYNPPSNALVFQCDTSPENLITRCGG